MIVEWPDVYVSFFWTQDDLLVWPVDPRQVYEKISQRIVRWYKVR